MTPKSLSPGLPRLAVVIPCFNAEKWITRTIISVLDQDYPDLLVIVMDDGSTDGSVVRVQAFGDSVVLRTGPNRGACHARNAGMRLAAAQGATHVIFLDADDYFEGRVLTGAGRVAAETGADIVLSNNHIIRHDGTRLDRFVYTGRVTPETFFEGWMVGRHFAPVAVLMRIDFVDRIGGWDESLSRAQDTDMFLRAMFHDPLIMMNPDGSAIYNLLNPDSVSKNDSPRSTECRIRVLSGLLRRMRGSPFEPFMPLVLDKLYAVTRGAFRMKQTELGRRGVKELRAFGYRKHPGTRSHRLVSRLIGLEAKVRLWGN